jgi:serine acetyltransferase
VYRVLVFWFLHIELHWTLEVGERLRIYHGYCLVIHPKTRIGKGITLRHCVTLGNKAEGGGTPVLEDGVEVGAHVSIIGPITIGRDSIIGAGTVVTKDVPPDAIVAGNPGKVLHFRSRIGDNSAAL